MIREYIFPEELGRNIIWVMLSGFFLKVGAKENSFGQIEMPKNHYLFNLDKKELDESYKKYDNLYYIFLDGPVQYLEDERFKKIKKKVNIYYVGRLNNFWKKVENSQPLFSNDLSASIPFLNVSTAYPSDSSARDTVFRIDSSSSTKAIDIII